MARRANGTSLRALRVVAGRTDLRRYIAAFAIFVLAEWAVWIAALIYAFDRGGATEAGVVAFIMLVPAALFAPFAAALGDHHPRESVAFWGMLAQAVAMAATGAAMLADPPAAVIYAGATIAMALTTISRPTHFSLLPRLSESTQELTAANASTAVVEGAASVLSPALTAVLLAAASPSAVWLSMGMLTAAGSLLIFAGRPGSVEGDTVSVSGVDLLRSGLEGFRTIARRREPRLLVGLAWVQTVVEGALDVLIVALAIDTFGRGDSAVGVLNTALGVGALVGAIASTTLVGRRRLAPALLFGAVVYGLGIVGAGTATIFALALVGIGIAGAGNSFSKTAERTLLQRLVEDRVLTRVFGAMEGTEMLGLAAGALLAPILIAVSDERTATVVIGLLVPVLVLLRGRRFLELDSEAEVPARALELLTPMPMFAELSPEVLERVAAQLTPLDVGAGEIVIAEGDVGDRFYVIDGGTLTVTTQGREIAVLHEGDHFGEIALLRDIPRTATVTAAADSELQTLERDEFLEAITGLPRAAVIAHDQAQARIDELNTEEDD